MLQTNGNITTEQSIRLHMDVKYIGGDVPWTLPFGDHFYSASEASFLDTRKNTGELDTIARRHGFEPLYATEDSQLQKKSRNADRSYQWMNAGVLFTDKTIESTVYETHKTDFTDNHGHTFCYLCSINQHDHERTKPRDQSRRRKLIPYNNPKALKARSSSHDRLHRDPNTSNSISYRFIVRTGTRKNSGTRAQVFLYLYGTENNWTSVNLQTRTGANFDGFPSGSIRTICLKGPEIGELHHLNVNLVGARSDKEWFLKEIEITNLNTSVTWLCEFNCWLPKKDGGEEDRRVKPTINPEKDMSLDSLSVYILHIRTGGKAFAGTDSNIHVLIRGSTSQTRRLALTSNRSNLFEQNQLDTFAIVGWDIGDPLEITVDSDRSQIAADWDLKEMVMWKIIPSEHGHKQVQVYFPFNEWLGKKASTLKSKKDSYTAAEHHPRGPTCYHIAVKTGKTTGAGTNANVFLIIYGKNARTSIHLLDNPGIDDFERGKTSEFTIMDMDVGEIDRIKIWHDNSGAVPGWFLDSVIIRKKHSTYRPVTEIYIQRLEQTSKAMYQHAREKLKKIYKTRASSPKENDDQRSSRSKDYEDLGSNRGILRSPMIYDKTNAQRKVTWDEQSMGSKDEPIAIDTKRMKNMQKTLAEKGGSSQQIETGHFDHHAYWISSHNYLDKKWQIQSIEEQNSLNLDSSIRSALLLDRTASSSKIKSTISERDDDVYEFQANRWLAKDEGDKKIEVYLTPKSTKLSTHTNDESKSKSSSEKIIDSKKKQTSSSDVRHEPSERTSKYDLGPVEKSPKSLAPLDRSPRDPFKTLADDARSSQRSLEKYDRSSSRNSNELRPPPASERDLLARISKEPPYHPRSAAASAIDTRSSLLAYQRSKPTRLDNEPTSPLPSHRDSSSKISAEPPVRPKSAVRSVPELSAYRTTRNQVYSSAYGTIPMDDFH